MRTNGGTRRRLLRSLTLVTALAVSLAGTPTAIAADSSVQAEYTPIASVHPEPATPAPLLSNGNWILFRGTHFYKGDYVQVGKSRLIFQTDGNLVLYDEVGFPRWASGTHRRGQEAIFQHDGNLVVYVSRGDPFVSRTNGFPNLELSVRADGSLQIYDSSNGRVRWSTWTAH